MATVKKKTTLIKTEKEAKKIIAKERKSLRRRESLIKKIDSIYKSVEKIKDDNSNPISKKMISKALKHLESAMLCINLY